ncbi:MAG: hypothetical protein U1E30_03110 [Rhodoblastus sp.]
MMISAGEVELRKSLRQMPMVEAEQAEGESRQHEEKRHQARSGEDRYAAA